MLTYAKLIAWLVATLLQLPVTQAVKLRGQVFARLRASAEAEMSPTMARALAKQAVDALDRLDSKADAVRSLQTRLYGRMGMMRQRLKATRHQYAWLYDMLDRAARTGKQVDKHAVREAFKASDEVMSLIHAISDVEVRDLYQTEMGEFLISIACCFNDVQVH